MTKSALPIVGLGLTLSLAAAAPGYAMSYPTAMTGNAKVACDFEADLVFGRKIDLASKYVTPNFIDHNLQAGSKTMAEFQSALAKMPKFPGPDSGCPASKVVLNNGDYVVFVRESPRGTHFDVYRFEGRKIAEHWD